MIWGRTGNDVPPVPAAEDLLSRLDYRWIHYYTTIVETLQGYRGLHYEVMCIHRYTYSYRLLHYRYHKPIRAAMV